MGSPIAFPKLAFSLLDEAEDVYTVHKKFTDEIIENLHALFGNVFIQACEMVDSYNFKTVRYRTEDASRSVYKISTQKEQYTIFEDLNFCFCPAFQMQVLDKQEYLTCQHVLAVKICRITEDFDDEIVKDTQFTEFLNEHLNYLEDSKLI